MTFGDLARQFAEQHFVRWLLTPVDGGGWRAEAWSEGGARYSMATGATPEAATYGILEAPKLPRVKVVSRYFVSTDGTKLAVTYNDTSPLRSDGLFREVPAETWARVRDGLSVRCAPTPPDLDDLAGLL